MIGRCSGAVAKSLRLGSFAFALILVALAPSLVAQACGHAFVDGLSSFRVSGGVTAVQAWDPDGPGPQPELVVVAGSFTRAGNAIVNGLAAYDPTTGLWSSLGSGAAGLAVSRIEALHVRPNGELVAAGYFVTIDGVVCNSIARWNGTTWSPFGSGFHGSPIASVGAVMSLATLPNGDLVVAGLFSSSGGTPLGNVARWDGAGWSALGAGLPSPGGGAPMRVTALAVLPNGDLIAGGYFIGLPFANIARWNGTAWTPLAGGLDSGVEGLAVLPNGDLVAIGGFSTSGGVFVGSPARFNGTSWSALLPTPQWNYVAMCALPSGELILSGSTIDVWNGTTVQRLGVGPQTGVASTFTRLANGHVVAGGGLTQIDGRNVGALAVWDGAAWQRPARVIDGAVRAVLARRSGDVVIGGDFQHAGAPAPGVARWNGLVWQPLGAGLDGPVRALAELPNGDLVAGGSFTASGGVAASRVARFDGTAWGGLGAGTNGDVHVVLVLLDGHVVVGGAFTTAGGVPASRIARWNGSTWSPIGSGFDGTVRALGVLANGDLIAGGEFLFAGSTLVHRVARWNGTSWAAMGFGVDGAVRAVLVRADGELVIGGAFVWSGPIPLNRVARWTGSAWAMVGAGVASEVRTLTAWPNGEIRAGEARWNGSAWSGQVGNASSIAVTAAGEAFYANDGALPGQVLPGWVVVRGIPTCPASAVGIGAGCGPGTAAPALVVESLPFLGGSVRVRGDGLPSPSVVFVVAGDAALAAPWPLAAAFPWASAGCVLRVAPDLVDVRTLAAGTTSTAWSLVIPNTPALVGAVFHQQMVAVGTSPGGSVAATEALRLSLGAL
jgi:trimeric autotransporter adhesin